MSTFMDWAWDFISRGHSFDRNDPEIRSVLDEIEAKRKRKFTSEEYERIDEALNFLKGHIQS